MGSRQGAVTFSIVLLLLGVLCARVVARLWRRRHSLRYRLYLRSPLWRLRRQVWIIGAGGRCRQCGSRRQVTIHHRTYARLGHERYADITVLCWPCHQRVDAPRRRWRR